MDQEIEQKIWEYLDGVSSPKENADLTKLLSEDPVWFEKYTELKSLQELLLNKDLEMPSLRFTKNVMEQISQFHVAPAARNYINKNVIRGITAFFLVMIAGFFIYFLGHLHWTSNSSNNIIPQSVEVNKLNLSKMLNVSYITIFIGISAILGLILLDKFLQTKKNAAQQDR